MENKAFFMQGTNNMVMKDVPIPQIKNHEVLIKIDSVGICGSDMHYYQHGKIGDFIVEGDFILGHESAGEVIKVGKDVKTLVVGDRVALEPGKTCGKCKFCKSGKYNLCPDVEFFATPPYHGVFQNYVAHPEDMCFKLPDNVSNVEGALVEPLAVGLHAANVGNVQLGDIVVIFGTGCIGLMNVLACRAKGASKIIVVDILKNRLKTAKRIGATDIINAKEVDVLKTIEEITEGEGADLAIDAAGAEITIKQTVDVIGPGGTIVLVGMSPKDSIEFNFAKLMGKEAKLKTVFRYRNLYPTAIKAIASGTINVKDIVSHEFDFGSTKEAFDYVVENASEVVKAVIKIK